MSPKHHKPARPLPAAMRHGSVPDMTKLASETQSKELARQARAPLTPAMAALTRKVAVPPQSESVAGAIATPMNAHRSKSFFGGSSKTK